MNLPECLSSLKEQTHQSLEVIIADNFSIDKTLQIASDFGCRTLTCGPAPPRNNFFTAPWQRKAGAELAEGDFIFFADSDMTFPEHLIERCLATCDEHNADAIVVPEISTGEGFWSRCKTLERLSYLNDESMETPRFIRRSAYRKIGGWSEQAGAFDDFAFWGKIRTYGIKTSRIEVNLWHSEGRLSLGNLFRKKYNMGKSAKIKELRVGSARSLIIQLGPLRFLLLRKAMRNGAQPADMLGIFLMKTVEGAGLVMGLMSTALPREGVSYHKIGIVEYGT